MTNNDTINDMTTMVMTNLICGKIGRTYHSTGFGLVRNSRAEHLLIEIYALWFIRKLSLIWLINIYLHIDKLLIKK